MGNFAGEAQGVRSLNKALLVLASFSPTSRAAGAPLVLSPVTPSIRHASEPLAEGPAPLMCCHLSALVTVMSEKVAPSNISIAKRCEMISLFKGLRILG